MCFMSFGAIVNDLDRYRLGERVTRTLCDEFPCNHDQAATVSVLDGITEIIHKDDFIAINHGLELHRSNRHKDVGRCGTIQQQLATVKQRGG